MSVVPKEPPIIAKLNTFYLDIKRMLEHYQGEIGAGAFFFRAPSSEGALFFDQDEVLNGYLTDRNEEIYGTSAVDRLLDMGFNHNYIVDVYQLLPEEIYFWSALPTAEKIYKDLSTEFTDLEGLIKKMSAEKLTGYIDVNITGAGEKGLIFISSGEIIGGSFSWARSDTPHLKDNIERLIQKTKEAGGTFEVSRLSMEDKPGDTDAREPKPKATQNVLKMLEEYLSIFESVYLTQKNKDADFNSVIRKKFIENAEKYTFLDPFAAEFEYADRKITFIGEAQDAELAHGVIDSIEEVATDLGITKEFKKLLSSWVRKYQKTLNTLKINI